MENSMNHLNQEFGGRGNSSVVCRAPAWPAHPQGSLALGPVQWAALGNLGLRNTSNPTHVSYPCVQLLAQDHLFWTPASLLRAWNLEQGSRECLCDKHTIRILGMEPAKSFPWCHQTGNSVSCVTGTGPLGSLPVLPFALHLFHDNLSCEHDYIPSTKP